MGFQIGSKKPDAKTINITFQKKHIYFGLVFFVLVVLFHYFIYNPYTYVYVDCPNGDREVITKDTTMICELEVQADKPKDKIKDYNNQIYNNELKWITQIK